MPDELRIDLIGCHRQPPAPVGQGEGPQQPPSAVEHHRRRPAALGKRRRESAVGQHRGTEHRRRQPRPGAAQRRIAAARPSRRRASVTVPSPPSCRSRCGHENCGRYMSSTFAGRMDVDAGRHRPHHIGDGELAAVILRLIEGGDEAVVAELADAPARSPPASRNRDSSALGRARDCPSRTRPAADR